MLGLTLLVCLLGLIESGAVPEQITLAYNGNPTEMMVTWITMSDYKTSNVQSTVHYGLDPNNLTQTIEAKTKHWKSEGLVGSSRWTHHTTMVLLQPGQKYYYSVGSSEGISKIFHFTALDPKKTEFKAIVFGDMGVKENFAQESLLDAAQTGEFDLIFHIGDFAYDLFDDDGKLGDTFMNSIMNMSAYVPYMDFQHYKHRFTMPPNGVKEDNQFWSFDFGGVHFVGISSEYYGYVMIEDAIEQYKWLENDLKTHSQPWTVMFQHRPFYCSNGKPEHCNAFENKVTRDGELGMPGLETLVNKAGVDMMFYGHEHTYERFYPVYKNLTFKQRDSQHYHNSPTTV